MSDIRIDALCVVKNGMYVEDENNRIKANEFLIGLTPTTHLVMRRLPTSPQNFGVSEVILGDCLQLTKLDSWSGVLWSRRAAVEAEKAISAYKFDLNQRTQSAQQ